MRNIITPESYNAALAEGGHLLRGLIYKHQAEVHLALAPRLYASSQARQAKRAKRTAAEPASPYHGRRHTHSAPPHTTEAPPPYGKH